MHEEEDVGRRGGWVGITESYCTFDLNLQACHLFLPLFCGCHYSAQLICIVAI